MWLGAYTADRRAKDWVLRYCDALGTAFARGTTACDPCMQVLELARFYHATPNVTGARVRGSNCMASRNSDLSAKRKSPRNLAISWG
jgi:hypothetical protein